MRHERRLKDGSAVEETRARWIASAAMNAGKDAQDAALSMAASTRDPATADPGQSADELRGEAGLEKPTTHFDQASRHIMFLIQVGL